MNTNFVLDKSTDAYIIWSLLQDQNDPAGRYGRAESMGINQEQADRIAAAQSYEEIQDYLDGLADERYRIFHEEIDKKKKDLKDLWETIEENSFYKSVVSFTNLGWEFNEYKVIVSAFHGGTAADSGEKTICISAWMDTKTASRTFAHELLMTLFYQTISIASEEAKRDSNNYYFATFEILSALIIDRLNGEYQWWGKEITESINLSNYPESMQLILEDFRNSSELPADFNDLFEAVLQEVKDKT